MSQPMPTAGFHSLAEFQEQQKQTRARLAEFSRRVQHAKDSLAEGGATVSAKDRSVTISVNPGGMMTKIAFGPGSERKSAAQLAAAVMEAYRDACRQAVERTMAVMSELTDNDSETMRALRANLPPEVAPEAGDEAGTP